MFPNNFTSMFRNTRHIHLVAIGGIGVAEAVLTSFLMLAGLGADEAFAAAVVFRIATFYIPAGEGFFAMRWLEKNGHL